MAKTNHDLRTVLSELKDWAGLEGFLAETPEARKAWREVGEWAEGTATKHKITLSKLPESMGRMAGTARPGSVIDKPH
jgi:hypothetical protein